MGREEAQRLELSGSRAVPKYTQNAKGDVCRNGPRDERGWLQVEGAALV